MFDPDAIQASNASETQPQDELLQGRVTDVTARPKEASTLEAIYDEHQKIIFLFDISGSMSMHLAHGDIPEMSEIRWEHPDNEFPRLIIEALRGNIGLTDLPALAQALQVAMANEGFLGPVCEVDPTEEARITSADPLLLKAILVSTRNWMAFGDYRNAVQRIQMVKLLAKEQIERRLQKYPNADIEILAFDSATHRMRGTTVLEKLESFQAKCIGGLTAIGRAIKDALQLCKKAPSSVGLHHLILVTDAGQNKGHFDEDKMLAEMKKLGVVFDMILVGGILESWTQVFKNWAAETGGDFECVQSAHEFRQKFLAAAERKCLPPASN